MNNDYYIAPISFYEHNFKVIRMEDIVPYDLDQVVQGILSPYYTPILKIKIPGVNEVFEAAIDTGAYKSHITRGFAETHRLIASGYQRALYAGQDGAHESPLFDIKFEIEGINNLFTEEFAELPGNYLHPIILGSKFLACCKEFRFHPDRKEFELFM